MTETMQIALSIQLAKAVTNFMQIIFSCAHWTEMNHELTEATFSKSIVGSHNLRHMDAIIIKIASTLKIQTQSIFVVRKLDSKTTD